jgi:flavin-dependent dehydrogenase
VVKTDIAIIGGGPAGLAAAIAARDKGFTVAVVDAPEPPIDKPCGEGLMPGGVEALTKLGVAVPALDSWPFRGIRFLCDDVTACAKFPDAYGLGVRRTTLHALLAERAATVGVNLVWNTPVRGLEGFKARWIVGADGLNSRVREWAGFDASRASVRRFGFRRHFPVTPWNDTVDVHWGHECQVYVTPVSASEVCVAVISRHQFLRLNEALAKFPVLKERLGGLVPTTPERGSVTECRRLPSVYRGNVALLGDASGSVDALTGEGLTLCFEQAFALADALACGDLSAYDAAHKRIARPPSIMGRLMLLLDGRARLRRQVIKTLASNPLLFSRLLAFHVGGGPLSAAGSPWFKLLRTH